MESDGPLLSIFKPLCDKVELLKTHMEFLNCIKCNKPESLNMIKRMKDKVHSMSLDIQELKNLLKKHEIMCEEMKVEEIEISHLLYKLDLLDQQTQSMVVNNSDDNCCEGADNSIPFEQIESVSSSVEDAENIPCVELSPLQFNSAPRLSRKDLLQQSLAFDIAYLTKDEYKLLPKYMVGRLVLEEINKFVDVINDALSKKYNILSKTMSVLKTQELSLYRIYKRQQTFELKGKHFITEEDIAREYNKVVLEKKAYSYLTILRHTKRLLRNVINGNVVYMVTT